MLNWVIGNVVSAVSVIFLMASCRAESRRQVYRMQFAETALCAVSAAFFGAWSGLSTITIALYRNYRNMEDTFTRRDMIATGVLTVAAGLWVNVDGRIGWIPVLATLELTLANYYARSVCGAKCGILVNTAMWMVYFFLIGNIASGLGQILILGMGIPAVLPKKSKKLCHSIQ